MIEFFINRILVGTNQQFLLTASNRLEKFFIGCELNFAFIVLGNSDTLRVNINVERLSTLAVVRSYSGTF